MALKTAPLPLSPREIETPGGERLVLVPKADWDRMLALGAAAEDAADIAIYDRAKARLVAGADELVPPAVTDALLAGANPIAVWRRHRGMRGNRLAAEAGISPAYLTQLERGRRKGSVDVLRRIAAALGVDLDDLVPFERDEGEALGS